MCFLKGVGKANFDSQLLPLQAIKCYSRAEKFDSNNVKIVVDQLFAVGYSELILTTTNSDSSLDPPLTLSH